MISALLLNQFSRAKASGASTAFLRLYGGVKKASEICLAFSYGHGGGLKALL